MHKQRPTRHCVRVLPVFFLDLKERQAHKAKRTFSLSSKKDLSSPSVPKPPTTKKFCRSTTVADGSHNVSRCMTWLPISLKNAAKCDKWYQFQNLSITESLNANGAWKKTLVVQLQACHVSVSNKNQKVTRQILTRLARGRNSYFFPCVGAVALFQVLASVSSINERRPTLLRRGWRVGKGGR